jgi:hypothetical protein
MPGWPIERSRQRNHCAKKSATIRRPGGGRLVKTSLAGAIVASSSYLFNPDASRPTIVLALGVSF